MTYFCIFQIFPSYIGFVVSWYLQWISFASLYSQPYPKVNGLCLLRWIIGREKTHQHFSKIFILWRKTLEHGNKSNWTKCGISKNVIYYYFMSALWPSFLAFLLDGQSLSCLTFHCLRLCDGIGKNGEEVLWWWKHIVVRILIKNGGPSLGGVWALYACTGHRYFDVCVRFWIAVYGYSVTDLHMGIDRNERVKYVRNCTNNIDPHNHSCRIYLAYAFRSYHVFVSLAVTN